MLNRITPGAIILLLFVTSCSSLKQSTAARPKKASVTKPTVVNNNPKFLDNISVSASGSSKTIYEDNKRAHRYSGDQNYYPHSAEIEQATPLQLKYALLLNTEVEEIRNPGIYKFIDDWYGTRYCMGGTTKDCIDCSAFVQTFFSTVFGISIPRTARDQYDAADKISIRKLSQGDLLFFNTRGGVSHVGIYLQNNKFVHAATTGGVMISDLSEAYYSKHFIGAGEIGLSLKK